MRCLFLIFILSGLSACTLHHVPRPEVAFHGLTLQKLELDSSAWLLNLEYRNPGDRRLEIVAAEHALWLNNHLIGSGRSTKAVSIAPQASARQSVELRLENQALLDQLQALPIDLPCRYRLISKLTMGGRALSQQIQLSAEGHWEHSD